MAEGPDRGKGAVAALLKSPKVNKSVEVHDLLSDVGIYSYAAIVALSLHELYYNDWDKEFCKDCITQLMGHLKLPKQVEGVMLCMVEGQGSQSPEAYVDLLSSEPKLEGRSVVLVQDLVLLAVTKGEYDARMRVLIKHVARILDVPPEIIDIYEETYVQFLMKEHELTDKEKLEAVKRQRSKKIKRYALIGLATIGGGTIIGLTGGLAAPLIGAGLGTVLGGASMAALTSTAGVAIIGSLFGMAGAGLTGFKMQKRVGDVEEFTFAYLNCDRVSQQLHITIAISGWLSDDLEDNFTRPWRALVTRREQYYLRYESRYLLELGQAIQLILNFALSMAAQEALKFTVLSGLMAAIAWPASLLTLASVIDNPWGVCCRRSAEVGKHLADVLMSREQGQRPVTLIGFSLGARVIYYCLREMSQRPGCEGIVQDAVLFGAPVTGAKSDWQKLTRVVAGKIVNGYCRSDWLLKFLYRTLSVAPDVAGLQPIAIEDRRIVNVDLSDIVTGHSEYPEKLGQLLRLVGIETNRDLEAEPKMKKSASELPKGTKPTKTTLLSLRPSRSEVNLRTTGETVAVDKKAKSVDDSALRRSDITLPVSFRDSDLEERPRSACERTRVPSGSANVSFDTSKSLDESNYVSASLGDDQSTPDSSDGRDSLSSENIA